MKQIFYVFLITLLCTAMASKVQGQTTNMLLAKAKSFMQDEVPLLSFEENKGQVQGNDGNKVRFTVKAQGIDIFILNNGIAYQYKKVHYPEAYLERLNEAEPGELEKQTAAIRTETFRMDALLVDANENAEVKYEGKLAQTSHYYNHGVTDVAQYQKVIFKNIYPNIDWQLLFKNGHLEYEFVVHPGGNPEQIRFRYEHTEGLAVQKDGSLQLKSSMGNITDQAPVSFQEGKTINTAFVLAGQELHFKLDPYDITQPLIIDPTLQWATYYGGTDFDYSYGCATDLSGNVYIAGQTSSATFIASGGHQNTIGGDNDAYLVKFNPNGVRLWATYYGGTNLEAASGCATDAAGNVFLAGYTGSTTGIFTNGHQAALSGGYDGFLAKFDSNGLRIWATYYGGTDLEYGNDCTTDNAGNVYFTGRTLSSSNISSGGHQNTIGGSADGFLVKFNSNGVRQWGTYYGGTGIDDGQSCTTDNAGNVYLAGQTYSSSNIAFNGHQMNYVSLSDGYLVKFNSNGVRQWSTYYGGSGADDGRSCATDTAGNIYLAGRTSSLSGIASNGHQNTLAGGVEAFLAKFNTNGVRQWATYYGGEGTDNLRRCTTDQAGNIYLTGETQSVNGIAISGYLNTHNEGNYDAFLVKINSNGVREWGTYYGGTGGDYGFNCAVDATGNVFLCGQTTSLTGIASGGLQNTHSGGTYDAFLVKLSSESTPVPLTLTRFSATAVKNKTLLNWASAQEKNVTTIAVERSDINAREWTTIAIQNGKAGLDNQYEDWDNHPLNGMNLYRLKITDLDGSFTHSDVKKVFFALTQDKSISIYPNPNKGTFTVELAHPQNAVINIIITDISGRKLYQLNTTGNKYVINDATLSAGLYLITVQDGNSWYCEKLIVE